MMKNAELAASIIIGGPFWRLQQRLGLLGPDGLPPLSTALIFAAVAWLPPAILSAAQGTFWKEALGGRAFLFDFAAYARFLIAILVLVATEGIAKKRGSALFCQFIDAGLVPAEEEPRFTKALQQADRRGSSVLAEAIIVGIAYVTSADAVFVQVNNLRESWMGNLVAGQEQLSLAGWWTLLISLPLFWFILLRWFWRFLVMTILLRQIARLKLQLVATHPDLRGGIGFLGLYPTIFSGLIFALSCVVASTFMGGGLFADWPLNSLLAPFLMWVAIVLIIFVGPLTVFAPALLELKRRGLLEYGAFACEHNRAFEQKWIQRGTVDQDPLGAPEISSLADLTTALQSIRAMLVIPVGRGGLWILVSAAGLPWVAVLFSKVPFMEVLTTVVKALL